MILEIIICILAGIGAGFATGFSGISAALVISPMLVSFLHFDAYEAITIALLSDVLAAADATATYARGNHLRVRDSVSLLASVLLFTFVGSWVSNYLPSPALGSVSVIWSVVLGCYFFFTNGVQFRAKKHPASVGGKVLEAMGLGAVIGFISGFAGAGGGMTTLLVLTIFMGYEMKDAVATSVFIMTFTALLGGLSHVAIGGMPQLLPLLLCLVSTSVSALVFSRIAVKQDSHTLKRITGIFLMCLGVVMVIFYFFL